MRFLKKNKKTKKVILVISDLHLSAGAEVDGKKNSLEDFESDQELVDFFNYYSSGEYQNKEVELIINGDFLDFLAVPYIKYFDDEYWSEKAALEKLQIILDAHEEVFDALADFLSHKNKSVLYIIGNHDAELLFESMKEKLRNRFPEEVRSNFTITNETTVYSPVKGVFIQHGHEYEEAHHFSEEESIVTSNNGEKYFLPPWGSYYVTHVVNKYMQEREHANNVRPIKKYIVHGLIFDTFFIIRFLIANGYYYFMVRFMRYYRQKLGWKKIIEDAISELTLFQDYEQITRGFFTETEDSRVLVVGHTHEAVFTEYDDGTTFINTGTWMRMVNLDLSHDQLSVPRTYAKIDIYNKDFDIKDFKENVNVDLLRWIPRPTLPFESFK